MDNFLAHLLVVDDDEGIRSLVKKYLDENEYLITTANSAEDASEKLKIIKFDLIILDIMMPGKSGLEFIEDNKNDLDTPIILLTAKGQANERVEGLETGADDYITKPFSVNELVARVKAVLRRIRPMFVDEVLTYKGIVIDLVSHSASRDGETLHLGPTEFNLLAFFMEKIGRVFSREQLLNHVWKNDAYVEPRTVDVHIRRLRKAINNDVKEDFIRTVRSAGYCFGS